MKYIQKQSPDQLELYQLSIDDAVSSDSWVRLLSELIDEFYRTSPELLAELTFGSSEGVRTPQGRPKYKRSDLMKLLFYGYIEGITSSRKLERECYRNVEVMWLLGGLKPDHWTINNFRKQSKEHLESLESVLRKKLQSNELIEGKVVALDGTKVIANTSRSYYDAGVLVERIQKVEYRMSEYLEQLSLIDDQEELRDRQEERHQKATTEWAKERELLKKERESLQAKIRKLEKEQEQLHTAQKNLQASGKKYYCPTDPEARVMKTKEGSRGAYNLQAAVDEKHKFILSSSIVQDENDIHQLSPMVAKIIEDLGNAPETIVADAGYNHYDSIEQLEEETQTEYYVNQNNPKTEKQDEQEDAITFRYNEELDEMECSEGGRLVLEEKNQKHKGSKRDRYRGIDCTDCKKRNQCTTSKKGRTVYRYHNQDKRDAYKQKMELPESKKILNKRKAIVEHVFGGIKTMMGRTQLPTSDPKTCKLL